MFRFFRNIRKNLASANKPLKYLMYAFGEITLVVIGILIALKINNWNEYQKERALELTVLKELAENLEANIPRFESMIERCNTDNHSADVILKVIDQKLPYHDSLNRHFYFALNPVDEGSFLSYVGFESMKNVGFEIIRDDQLKQKIIYLFEGDYRDLIGKYNRVNLTSTPHLSEFRDQNFVFYLDTVNQQIGHSPLNYDNLITDKYLKSWLESTKGVRLWINISLNKSLEATQSVLEQIKEKLST